MQDHSKLSVNFGDDVLNRDKSYKLRLAIRSALFRHSILRIVYDELEWLLLRNTRIASRLASVQRNACVAIREI